MANSVSDKRESKKNPVRNLRRDAGAGCKKALDDALDLGLQETFPGSDPVSVIQPVGTGCKDGT
jgi:hypothetical protein